MTIPFYKYQGTGNDFVMIDDRDETFPADDQALVERLCHRRFGIGADGLILLRNDPGYDFRMIYFNADGAEGSMCGNGGRCIVRFAHDLGLFDRDTRFVAVDGEHEATVTAADVSLKMSDVGGVGEQGKYVFLNTGSPHAILFTDDIDSTDVVAEGRVIRYSEPFSPGGTNVNFVQQTDESALYVRTYERGVEDETYSCGTGVTAAALAAYQQLGVTGPVAIRTLGGNLRVSFKPEADGTFTNVYLIGPAQRVFAGTLVI